MEKIANAIENNKSLDEIKNIVEELKKEGDFNINKEFKEVIMTRKTNLLEFACRNGGSFEIIKYFIEQGADIPELLRYAIMNDNWDLTKYLIDTQPERVNESDNPDGYFPLYDAVLKNNLEIIKLLLAKGADINKRTKSGYSSLELAVRHENIEIAEFLIKNGIDVNTVEEDFGHSPLYKAAITNNDLHMVKLLVENGANINQKDKYGESILYEATAYENIEIVKFLVDNGVDVNIQNNDGCTALHNAIYSERMDIAKILVDAGADVNLQDKDGNTPANILLKYYLMDENYLELFEILVKGNKINTKLKDNKGCVVDIDEILNRIIKLLDKVKECERE